MTVFTARCYAERGIATASCLSVRDHITSKLISRLVSLQCGVRSLQTAILWIYSKGNTPKFWLQ